ncbi:MAG: hypothetical protein H7319_02885 [Spirosoma sp.]|nr:hypothetical protein [Spirosoma sp.]
MKRLLLPALLSLLATAGFAQNVGTVSQNGTNNTGSTIQNGSSLTATVSQVGTVANTVSNTGITNQSGTGHTATVTQDGGSTFNRAYITQIGTSSGANSATLSQNNGSGGNTARGGNPAINTTANVANFSGIYQVGSSNVASVNQDGTGTQGNLGESIQKGTSNTATTTQSGGALNGVAQVFQGFEPGPASTTVVGVDVAGNKASINQDASLRNQATIRQFSDGNTATVEQDGSSSAGNIASVVQGDGVALTLSGSNTATVEQSPNSLSNTAGITQLGYQNTAEVEQYSFSGMSSYNVASVTQTAGADRNLGKVYQGGLSESDISSYNVGTILQKGDDGAAYISQISNANYNNASIEQGVGSSFDKAGIYQSASTSATASITQNLTATGNGMPNLAEIDQTGSKNLATIAQEGSANKAGIQQIATGAGSNTATVTQTGNYNMVGGPGTSNADFTTGVTSFATQNGAANSMVVTQMAATGTSAIHNTAMLSQTGTGNILTVNQTISAGAMGGNTATVSQNGNGNVGSITQINGMTP